MAIVAVVNVKGGTGKTTTAVNLSIMRASRGRDVMVVDTDPEGSASFALAIRGENGVLPRVSNVQKFGRGLAAELQAMATKYDDLIIDAGGKSNDEIKGALIVADIALIPMQVSQLDLWALVRMSELVQDAKVNNPNLDAAILLNRASTNPSVKDEEAAIDLLKDFPDFRLCSTVLRDRTSIRRSIVSGLSISEYSPADPKARAEFESLFGEVFKNG